MSYSFWVDGQPIPKARPRLGKNGAYTPEKTKAWEYVVSQNAAIHLTEFPFTEDVWLTLEFYRKGKQRADLDNLIKSVMDALNNIMWLDDKQVVRITASVSYGSKLPGVRINVEPPQY